MPSAGSAETAPDFASLRLKVSVFAGQLFLTAANIVRVAIQCHCAQREAAKPEKRTPQ